MVYYFDGLIVLTNLSPSWTRPSAFILAESFSASRSATESASNRIETDPLGLPHAKLAVSSANPHPPICVGGARARYEPLSDLLDGLAVQNKCVFGLRRLRTKGLRERIEGNGASDIPTAAGNAEPDASQLRVH
jgi:hypothetical protein